MPEKSFATLRWHVLVEMVRTDLSACVMCLKTSIYMLRRAHHVPEVSALMSNLFKYSEYTAPNDDAEGRLNGRFDEENYLRKIHWR